MRLPKSDIRELYFSTWEARKIVEIPVIDALRKPYIITSNETDLLKDEAKRLDLDKTLRECLILERLDGGCGLLIEYDNDKDLSEKPSDDSYISKLTVVPRDYISFQNLSPDILETESEIYINAQKIHSSRIILFRGFEPLSLIRFFSNSVLLPIYKDIERARDVRELIYRLTKKSSVIIASVDGMSMSDEEKLQQIRNALQYMSNEQSIVVDETNLNIHEYSSSFGALPELMMSYLKVLASSLDVPVTRFLGLSNSGLTQSADGDLENYYNMLQGYQSSHIVPVLTRLYTQICLSLGISTDDLNISFPPLWNINEEETDRSNNAKLEKVIKALDAGLINREEAISELNLGHVFKEKIGDAEIGNINNAN